MAQRSTHEGAAGELWPAGQPSEVFSDHLLQDLAIQRQIGDDPLQPRVLVLEHLQAPQLGDL